MYHLERVSMISCYLVTHSALFKRSYSYPISLRPKASHHHKNHTHTSSQYSHHSHHHHHHKHHCHKSHKSSAQPGKDDGGGDMTLVGKGLGAKK